MADPGFPVGMVATLGGLVTFQKKKKELKKKSEFVSIAKSTNDGGPPALSPVTFEKQFPVLQPNCLGLLLDVK